jgi:hypothetical protein
VVVVTYVRMIPPPEGMEWRHFECSTGAGEEDECDYTYLAPIAKDAHREAAGPIDFCPKCGEYLSLHGSAPGAFPIMVAETSSEQWAHATLEPKR